MACLYTEILMYVMQVDRLEEARKRAVERWQQPVGALSITPGPTFALELSLDGLQSCSHPACQCCSLQQWTGQGRSQPVAV